MRLSCVLGGDERSFRVWAAGHQPHGKKEVKAGGGKVVTGLSS